MASPLVICLCSALWDLKLFCVHAERGTKHLVILVVIFHPTQIVNDKIELIQTGDIRRHARADRYASHRGDKLLSFEGETEIDVEFRRIGVRGLGGYGNRLKFREYLVLRHPFHRRALALRFFDAVEISVQAEREL